MKVVLLLWIHHLSQLIPQLRAIVAFSDIWTLSHSLHQRCAGQLSEQRDEGWSRDTRRELYTGEIWNLLTQMMNTEQENNLHSCILRQHGQEVLKLVRQGEKTQTKLARRKNHHHFN
ncbi:hypothetical protein DPMN_177730 [Dreissena polymorpha]|uniref:Uncharacterized protein n=1 Tax=Dreissena polymorpha TaxID=45954 RepID=A0A9D4EBJ4_DREPO|nr:hypothetical protein DPMN_177730 [Dreissena polymorpha]